MRPRDVDNTSALVNCVTTLGGLPTAVNVWSVLNTMTSKSWGDVCHTRRMAAKLRMKYVLPNSTAIKMRTIEAGQTIQQVIDCIARLNGVDIDQLSLNDCILDPDGLLADYYDSQDQLFVLSKASSAPPRSP